LLLILVVVLLLVRVVVVVVCDNVYMRVGSVMWGFVLYSVGMSMFVGAVGVVDGTGEEGRMEEGVCAGGRSDGGCMGVTLLPVGGGRRKGKREIEEREKYACGYAQPNVL